MDKFDCLGLFIRVAQLGSFTAAANELNTTQGAVSKKIAWLEKQVGFTLFHRNARAISLTDSGRQYLQLAIKLTEEIDLAESLLRDEQASVVGQLKISVPSAFSYRILAKPLNDFLTQHPNLRVDVSVSDKFVDLIDSDIDVAIRASYLKDSGLKAKYFFENQLVYFAAPNYLKNFPALNNAQQLTEHQCLTYSLMTPSNLWRFNQGEQSIKVKVNEQLRSDNPEMLLQMAKLGQGIAALPKWMIAEELERGELVEVLSKYERATLPMYMVYKNEEHQPFRIRAFINFLADYFSC